MNTNKKYFDEVICVTCGDVFYVRKKRLNTSRAFGTVGFKVRRFNSVNCSKKCSRKYFYGSSRRVKLNKERRKPHRVRIKR